MRLVNDDVLEGKLLQRRLLDETHLVRRNADFEILRNKSSGDNLRTFVLRARECDDPKVGSPLGELACPVLERGFWDDDEMGSGNVAVVLEVGEEGDGLESLAQAHLVGEDTVEAIVMQRDHPVQTLQLVATHLAADICKGLTRGQPNKRTKTHSWERTRIRKVGRRNPWPLHLSTTPRPPLFPTSGAAWCCR